LPPSDDETTAVDGSGDGDMDGMLAVIAGARLRFRRDLRLHEVRRQMQRAGLLLGE
jgi:hypothetical protein